MPVYVVPDPNLPNIILYRFGSSWTWDEMMIAFNEEIAYGQQLPEGETYDVLVDLRGVPLWKAGLRPQHLSIMGRMNPKNFNCVVMVHTSEISNLEFEIMLSGAHNLIDTVYRANCIEDAYTIITAQRQ
jgi:hypothetical protein